MNITALLLMIVLMLIIGYVGMTILIDKNITNNLNKFYNALFMAFIMILAKMVIFDDMYDPIIIGGLALGTIITYVLVKRQSYINPVQYLLGMIEHHEMAVAMSSRLLKKKNVPAEVKELATNIITLQNNEIELMRKYINKINKSV